MSDQKTAPLSGVITTDTATGSVHHQTFHQALQDGPEPMNIFVAAQRGDVEVIKDWIESGKAKATDVDESNVTPLHWAAINAQMAACKYLLSVGASVDAQGGDLHATPMQWAASSGFLYIIQLLTAHGADPSIADSQGYNTLHLATHSSHVMPLLYILQQPVPVDSRDAQGHTSLMWAAYQGDALSVDLLLKHGAMPNTSDDAGLTPLHWAVVRGNGAIIRRLVEKGADMNAKDNEGRTPKEMAVELKALGAWKRALEQGAMNEDGIKRQKPLNDRNTKTAILLLPTLFFFLIFTTLAWLPWYTGIILAMALFFGMHHIVSRVLLNRHTTSDNVQSSPYFAGIILASMTWVFYAWITRLVHQQHHPFSQLLFALSIGTCAYNFFRSITLDPGTAPVPRSDAELKSIIEDLAIEGRLNGQTFCIVCMAKKPLRSKHCRTCDRCIARCDHHCPWVWNCVGANNHRQFLIFVISLVSGIVTFDYLVYQFFSSEHLPASLSPSCPLSPSWCAITAKDPFLLSIAVWSTLQLTWTSVLLISQLWQISRQMTSLEVSNLGRYGFMGGRGSPLRGQMGAIARVTGQVQPGSSNSVAGSLANIDADLADPHAGHNHSHGGSKGTCNFLMSVLGFDRFTKGRATTGLAMAGKATNPFDLGMIGNCKDFWTRGKELGVEYERLYDVPNEGFREAKARRRREEEEDGRSNRQQQPRKGLLMGLGLLQHMGMGRRSTAGYEQISNQA